MPQVEERQPTALDICSRQPVPGGRRPRGHGYITHIIHTVPRTGQDTGQMSDRQMGTHPLAWPWGLQPGPADSGPTAVPPSVLPVHL